MATVLCMPLRTCVQPFPIRQELRQKLAEKGHPRGAIEQAIARLTEVVS